ncbi:uncharacterized protein ACIBXB_000480 [Morphnus guianensis]
MGPPSPRRSVGSAVRKKRCGFGVIWPLLLALAPVPAAPSLVAMSCRDRDAAGVDAAGLACAAGTWQVFHGAGGEGNMPAGRAGWGRGRWLQGPLPSRILAVCLLQCLLLLNHALGARDNREEEHDSPLADADAAWSRHGGSGEHSTLSCRLRHSPLSVTPRHPCGVVVPSHPGKVLAGKLRSGVAWWAERAISQTDRISLWDADGVSLRSAILAGERRCVPED